MRVARSLLFAVCAVSTALLSCGGDNSSDDNPSDQDDMTDDGPKMQCNDGIDNDGDGKIDYPEDPGCDFSTDDSEDTAPKPQCKDGRDNDGDGKMDYPDDPGCIAPEHDIEMDDCPDGVLCPQCGNGRDDDMNGTMDYPGDPGCDTAADPTEFVSMPTACGPLTKIELLPGDGIVMGNLDQESITNLASDCANSAGAPAIAYVFQLTESKVVVASTDDAGTTVDTVLSIRPTTCTDPALVCNDNITTGNLKSKIEVPLDPGTYYLIVQGYDPGDVGPFRLNVQRFAGEGSICTTQNDCGPGLTCRTPAGESQMVCSVPICRDSRDDDGDGKIDFPADPGCATPDGTSETDDCPAGPNCPECADGMDNDSDTQTDYPMDLTCQAASNDSESCDTSEGVIPVTGPVIMGSFATANDDVEHPPACLAPGAMGRDLTYRIEVPQLTSLSFSSSATNLIHTLLDSTCGGTAIQCSATSPLTRTNVPAGTYYYVVDGKTTAATGAFTVNVAGKIADGQSCESPLALSGALTCGTGLTCKGTMGSRTCQRAQCSDGMDNNGAGGMDYPADPGCDSPADDAETTVCPGAMCPVCADGMDNDSDGRTDYPMDTSCSAASGMNESCNTSEGVILVTQGATPGTTVGAANDSPATCTTSTAMANDLMYELRLPALTTLTLNVTGALDSINTLYNSTCGGTPVFCSDSQSNTRTNVAAGTYYFQVDGYFATPNTYPRNVSGKVADGGSCESPLFTSGALTCATAGFVCGGTAGSRTCRGPQCSDGIDNNGTGGTDFPNDPGCTSPLDATEETVTCPGAGCPQCANTTDDDTDTLVDYPTDYGCAGRGSNTEEFCDIDPDFGGVIDNPLEQNTLAGITSDSPTTCGTASSGNDRVFALQLPVPVASLVIDTNNSTVADTVLTLRDASCGTIFACDDEGGDTAQHSKITLTNVNAGNYAVTVKAYSTSSNGGFNLNTRGTVAPMTSCTSPLFAAGVLVCPAGTTCSGAAGAQRCQ